MKWSIQEPHLRQWSERNLQAWPRLNAQVIALGNYQFQNDAGFHSRLKVQIRDTSFTAVLKLIRSVSQLRTYLHLWSVIDTETKAFPQTQQQFARLQEFEFVQTRSCFLAVMQVWFAKYDQPPVQKKLMAEYVHYLATQVTSGKSPDSPVNKLLRHRQLLLSEEGPREIAEMAIKNRQHLHTVLQSLGVEASSKSPFMMACFGHYYIKQLASCKLGEAIPALVELAKPHIHKQYYSKGLTLGHESIRIMIDRALESNLEPGKHWINFILNLTGDPRAAVEGTTGFKQWWWHLGERRRLAMLKWLAQDDLELFLEILKDHARQSDEDMLRMFQPRKQFLERIAKKGLIRSARLFLSKAAHQFVLRRFSDRKLSYAQVEIGEQSFIYLDLESVHMVEGSHNASVRLYDKLWPNCKVTDFYKRHFRPDDIRPRISTSITHNGSWQLKLANSLLESGLKCTFEDLLDSSDWWQYREKYGSRGYFDFDDDEDYDD